MLVEKQNSVEFNANQSQFPTLLSRFSENVAFCPKALACSKVSLKGAGFLDLPLSYEELAARARSYAQIMQSVYGLKQGDRIILCVSDPHAFLSCILGAMIEGFIIVPLPTFSDFGVPDEFIKRIRLVQKDCDPSLIIIENSILWNRHMGETDFHVPVVEVDEIYIKSTLMDPTKEACASFPVQPLCDIAFIQYTSGSTGNPKGVVITHENLAANLFAMGIASKVNSKTDRLLSWLPLYHDMGLVGSLFFTIYWRIPSYIFSPLTFITRPVAWLKGIDHFKITYSVGPTFAYNIALKKISDRDLSGLDLSSWRLAFIGAEPIDVETAQGFIQKFRKYGFRSTSFYPVYGMAETTLALSFPASNTETRYDCVDRLKLINEKRAVPTDPLSENSLSFVSVGKVLPNHFLKICDPNSENIIELPERSVGEIVAKGPSISPYYFKKNDLQKKPREQLRTGDLGYIANGELFVLDRLKDLIIVAGQNFIPSDIEARLSKIKGLRVGRVVAFSNKNNEGTESLYIAAEINPRVWRSQNEIRKEIIASVHLGFGLKVEEVIFVSPGFLPKTSSGKVKRRASRDLFIEGKMGYNLSVKTLAYLKWKFASRKALFYFLGMKW